MVAQDRHAAAPALPVIEPAPGFAFATISGTNAEPSRAKKQPLRGSKRVAIPRCPYPVHHPEEVDGVTGWKVVSTARCCCRGSFWTSSTTLAERISTGR